MRIRATVRGARELRVYFEKGLPSSAIRDGLEAGATVVEAHAKADVHVVTRKLQSSLGVTMESDYRAVVSPRPGFGAPRRYTKAQTSHWKRPRDGVNNADPQVYAKFEEGLPNQHPFLVPALHDNVVEVVTEIYNGVVRSMGRMP